VILAVTGGTGFVGGELVSLAAGSGHSVRALTRRGQPARGGVSWVEGDLSRPEALAALVEGADAVVHVAGAVNAPDAAAFEAANVAGTQAILDAAHAAGVRRFVHVSSLAAREPQLSAYGASKARAEVLVRASALDWTMVRPPAVYGPGDTDMLDLFKAARWRFVPMPPAGRMSLIHAADLARLLLVLARTPGTGMLYEADDGRDGGWTHAEFGRAIGRAVGTNAKPLPLPQALLALAARVDRVVRGERAVLTQDRVNYMCHPDWTIDPAKRPPAQLWKPQIGTQAGLKATAAAYRVKGWL
jgi:nucleoside-diphosphate-sugar epimerase